MRRRSNARPEDAIQRAVFQHLKQRAMPGVYAFHVPNGGKRKPIEASIMKGLGVRAGVPDVIAIYRSHTYALELKSESGVLSQNQKAARNELELAGATWAVAYGIDASIRQLETWGLLRGRSA